MFYWILIRDLLRSRVMGSFAYFEGHIADSSDSCVATSLDI